MRALVRLVAAASVLVIAGCNILDLDYYREGIGSDLYRAELPEVARLQDEYIDLICRQANLAPPGITPEDRCVLPTFSREWSLFVQAGMNDIDLRCDRFLNWVDYHRRNDKNITKQIGDTVAAISTIARVTGSPDRSLDVLAAALGLASNTFANVSARLLVLADQTTIQSVVVVNQNKYRFAIRSAPIDNRPAAIHALRSYLRICMPATIETEINTNTVVAQRGGSGGIAAIQSAPLSNPATSPPPPVIRSTDQVRVTPAVRLVVAGALGPIEATITPDVGRSIQAALCVEPTGDFGSSGFREQLRQFNAATLLDSKSAANPPDSIALSSLRDALTRARSNFPSCTNAGFRNGFEVGIFSRFSFPSVRGLVAKAMEVQGLPVPAGLTTGGATVDPILRKSLGALRLKFDGQDRDVLDPAFYVWIRNASVR